jgi:hypothetical protein
LVFWYRITHAIREEPEEKILDALLEGEEVENPGMLNPNRCARPGGVFQTPFAPAFRDEGLPSIEVWLYASPPSPLSAEGAA